MSPGLCATLHFRILPRLLTLQSPDLYPSTLSTHDLHPWVIIRCKLNFLRNIQTGCGDRVSYLPENRSKPSTSTNASSIETRSRFRIHQYP